MGKGIVLSLILVVICMVSGCYQREREDVVSETDAFIFGRNAIGCAYSIAEAVRLECCARQIEKAISLEVFMYGSAAVPKEVLETDVYYDSIKRKAYYHPKGLERLYTVERYPNYERYEISWVDMPWEVTERLEAPSCNWIGTIAVNYGIEKEYRLPELSEEDYALIDILIEEVDKEFARRREHFSFNIYLGDFIRGDKDGMECVMIAIAIKGDGEFYVRAELTKKEDAYDVWMYPSPFGLPDPTMLDERNLYSTRIENILELDKLVGHIER